MKKIISFSFKSDLLSEEIFFGKFILAPLTNEKNVFLKNAVSFYAQRFPSYSIAASTSSSGTVAKLVAESLMA